MVPIASQEMKPFALPEDFRALHPEVTLGSTAKMARGAYRENPAHGDIPRGFCISFRFSQQPGWNHSAGLTNFYSWKTPSSEPPSNLLMVAELVKKEPRCHPRLLVYALFPVQ